MNSQKRQATPLNKIQQLKERTAMAEAAGGEVRLQKQHEAGKLSARERINFLLDEGSFEELTS